MLAVMYNHEQRSIWVMPALNMAQVYVLVASV